jgi:hypothetical protein
MYDVSILKPACKIVLKAPLRPVWMQGKLFSEELLNDDGSAGGASPKFEPPYRGFQQNLENPTQSTKVRSPTPPKNLTLPNRKTRAMFWNLRAFPKMLGQFGVFAILGGCGGLCSREHFLRIQKPKIS